MRIAIRVDASLEMGTGHFMRCLTLADAMRRYATEIRFISRMLPPHLRALLAERGHALAMLAPVRSCADSDGTAHAAWLHASQTDDSQATLGVLADCHWDWMLVDHYALDARWETSMRARVRHLLVIDDLADRRHDCDILLDQNWYARIEQRYADLVPAQTTMLLGPTYALLRPEFADARATLAPREGPVQRLLVFIGGADADNITGQVLAVVRRAAAPSLAVDVVIGASHPQRTALVAACHAAGWTCHVQSSEMAALMSRADLAIGAGGSATWERCCLGLPTLTLCIAANQRRLVDDAAASGLVCAPSIAPDDAPGLERHLLALFENPGLRRHLAQQGWNLVDGGGVQRVVDALRTRTLAMRLASEADSVALHNWRNAPEVRRVSRNNALIGLDEHKAWFKRVLGDPQRALLIGELDGAAVGVVRFDLTAEGAEVSIYLLAERIGQGLGTALLSSAERWLREQHPEVRCITAEVLPANVVSHRLFLRAGYVGQSTHYSKKVTLND